MRCCLFTMALSIAIAIAGADKKKSRQASMWLRVTLHHMVRQLAVGQVSYCGGKSHPVAQYDTRQGR